MRKLEWLTLVAILILGAFLRLYELGEYPGLWPDEGVHFEYTRNILRGEFRAFTAESMEQPPLLFFVVAVAFKLFGASFLVAF